MEIDGQCHCGRVTYEAEIDPAKVSICHCTDCQTLSGSAFRVNIQAPAEHFVLLSGTPKSYVKTAESGNKRRPKPSAVIAARRSMPVRRTIHRAMVCASARSPSAPPSRRGRRSGGGRRCIGSRHSPPCRHPKQRRCREFFGSALTQRPITG